MMIKSLLKIYFLLCVCSVSAFEHKLSKKVMHWDHSIKIYKCPIYATQQIENDIDPSILVFKSKHATQSLEKTPIILADQTNHIIHHVKKFATFNQFTFAYASMASLHNLFDKVHIINEPGQFDEKTNSKNLEHIPDERVIIKLKTKTAKDNVFELKNVPVYKCLGKNNSNYLFVKYSSVTANLIVNDVIYSEKSDGFLETIRSIDQIDVANDEQRLIIETTLTDCSANQDSLENRIANLRLISIEKNDLNCLGGFKSNSSLYLTKSNKYISKLITENNLTKSVIIGRKSSRFAYRILSIKKIGKYLLLESSESLFPTKLKRFKRDCGWKFWECVVSVVKAVLYTPYDWNSDFGYKYSTSAGFKLTPVGKASASFSFNPSVTVTVSIQASLFDFVVKKAGLIFNVNANLDAKLKLNLENNIDYTWPEMTIIPKETIARFSIQVAPFVVIPGTVNVGLNAKFKLKAKTSLPLNINVESNLNLNLRFPFVYHDNGGFELPDKNCFNKDGSFFKVDTDFSGHNNQPKFLLGEQLIPYLNAQWPDIYDMNEIRHYVPNYLWFLANLLENAINSLQIAVTGSLPLFSNQQITLCADQCLNEAAVQFKINFGLNPFDFNLRGPFGLNMGLAIPPSRTPLVIFSPFQICLPIPLLSCPLACNNITGICQDSLINYWPMSNLSDVIGGANLYGGSSYSFVADRFNVSHSAIYFNSGYLQVPSGVYFSDDFTILVWIKLHSYGKWQRIIDFGNGDPTGLPMDNVFFGMSAETAYLNINTVDGTNKNDFDDKTTALKLNEWYHVGYVLQGYTGTIYVNGISVSSGYQNHPNDVTRNNNFIGKSWYSSDALADATYDELKIYNDALRQSYIVKEYNRKP